MAELPANVPPLLFKVLKVERDPFSGPYLSWGLSPLRHSFLHRLSSHTSLFAFSAINTLGPASIISHLPCSSHLLSPSVLASCYSFYSAVRGQVLSTVVALTKCQDTVGGRAILLERDGAMVSRRELLGHASGGGTMERRVRRRPETLLGLRGLRGWDGEAVLG